MTADIQAARALLEQSECVTIFSGAGLSAESGIATFRDSETDALWSRFDPMQLASAEGFLADRRQVMEWYRWRRGKLALAQPNPAHVAVAAQGNLIHITQNVDDLCERAGAAPEQIIHVHGTITADHCFAGCGYSETIDLHEPPGLRHCPDCGDYLRPSVVWFGESGAAENWQRAIEQCQQTDCLIVIGTSATVYPAAGLIEMVHARGGSIILINTHPSEASGLATLELLGPAGELVPALFAD
jgi:NAD-dependent deacetylase